MRVLHGENVTKGGAEGVEWKELEDVLNGSVGRKGGRGVVEVAGEGKEAVVGGKLSHSHTTVRLKSMAPDSAPPTIEQKPSILNSSLSILSTPPSLSEAYKSRRTQKHQEQ